MVYGVRLCLKTWAKPENVTIELAKRAISWLSLQKLRSVTGRHKPNGEVGSDDLVGLHEEAGAAIGAVHLCYEGVVEAEYHRHRLFHSTLRPQLKSNQKDCFFFNTLVCRLKTPPKGLYHYVVIPTQRVNWWPLLSTVCEWSFIIAHQKMQQRHDVIYSTDTPKSHSHFFYTNRLKSRSFWVTRLPYSHPSTTLRLRCEGENKCI